MRSASILVLATALAVGTCAQEPSPHVSPSSSGDAIPIAVKAVVVDDNRWRTHVPGAAFTVRVHIVGAPAAGAECTCQWVDAELRPLAEPVPVSATAIAMHSPVLTRGFLGLVFRSSRADIAFEPQLAGQPSSVFGFAVIPEPPMGAITVDEASPFGLVQGRVADPYLRMGSGPRVIGVHLKTKTWSQGTRRWARQIASRAELGHIEMPLIHGEPWDSDDAQPIAPSQLDAIGEKFAGVLSADSDVRYWQAGREENGGKPYEQAHYFTNLLAKVQRLRAEAVGLGGDVQFAYSTRGKDMREFEQLFASQAFRECYHGLAHDPYWWPDFPSPETWLPGHVKDLRSRMIAAGVGEHFLWFGEIGIPVRGTNDRQAFYGYPAKRQSVPGASLDYAARYLVKSHALALANGVPRIYWYNYQNRGGDIDYAEHHFGLRSFSGSRSDAGHPLPAYVAYIHMLANLKGAQFVAHRSPAPGVFLFEFAVAGTDQRRLLAWVMPARRVRLPLAVLATGLQADGVGSVTDIYGAAQDVIEGEEITLAGMPIYLWL